MFAVSETDFSPNTNFYTLNKVENTFTIENVFIHYPTVFYTILSILLFSVLILVILHFCYIPRDSDVPLIAKQESIFKFCTLSNFRRVQSFEADFDPCIVCVRNCITLPSDFWPETWLFFCVFSENNVRKSVVLICHFRNLCVLIDAESIAMKIGYFTELELIARFWTILN